MISTLKCSSSWQAGEQLCCQGPGSLGGHSDSVCCQQGKPTISWAVSAAAAARIKGSDELPLVCTCWTPSTGLCPGLVCQERWGFSRGSSDGCGLLVLGGEAEEAVLEGFQETDSYSLSAPLGGYGKEPGSSKGCILGWQWAWAATTEVQNGYKEKPFPVRAVKTAEEAAQRGCAAPILWSLQGLAECPNLTP